MKRTRLFVLLFLLRPSRGAEQHDASSKRRRLQGYYFFPPPTPTPQPVAPPPTPQVLVYVGSWGPLPPRPKPPQVTRPPGPIPGFTPTTIPTFVPPPTTGDFLAAPPRFPTFPPVPPPTTLSPTRRAITAVPTLEAITAFPTKEAIIFTPQPRTSQPTFAAIVFTAPPTAVPTPTPAPTVTVFVPITAAPVINVEPRTTTEPPTTGSPTATPTTAPSLAPAAATADPTVSPLPTAGPTEDPFRTQSRIVTVPYEGGGGFSTGVEDSCTRSIPDNRIPQDQRVVFAYELQTVQDDNNNNRMAIEFIETRVQKGLAKDLLDCRFEDDTRDFHIQSLNNLPSDSIVETNNCTTTITNDTSCLTVHAFITARLFLVNSGDGIRHLQPQQPPPSENITSPAVAASFTKSLRTLFLDSELTEDLPFVTGTSFLGILNADPDVLPPDTPAPTVSPTEAPAAPLTTTTDTQRSSRGPLAGRVIGSVAGALLLAALVGLTAVALVRRGRQRRNQDHARQPRQRQQPWESDEESSSQGDIFGAEIDQEAGSGMHKSVSAPFMVPRVSTADSDSSRATHEHDGEAADDSRFRLSPERSSPWSARPQHAQQQIDSFIAPSPPIVEESFSGDSSTATGSVYGNPSSSISLPNENAPGQWNSVIREFQMAEREQYAPSPARRRQRRDIYHLPDTMDF